MPVPIATGSVPLLALLAGSADASEPVMYTPSWSVSGEEEWDQVAAAVASGGDIDGDGYADVLVGAWETIGVPGWIEVFHGGADGLEASARLRLTGTRDYDVYGESVAGIGDVDGDGFDDVVAGVHDFQHDRGRIDLHLGGPDGLEATPAQALAGERPDSQFGRPLAPAGDVNGDGYRDLVVGAPNFAYDVGAVYVFHGHSGGLHPVARTRLQGDRKLVQLGESVAGAGDVDGDGFDDIIVGSPSWTAATGRVQIHHGSTLGVQTSPTTTLAGEEHYSWVGIAVAGIGDVDRDGFDDVAVGDRSDGSGTGAASIYFGSWGGIEDAPRTTLLGESSSDYFGGALAGAGDTNGDGHADLIVGADGYAGGTGRAYVFAGGPSGMAESPGNVLRGASSGDVFGGHVAGAGDVNGDGYDDVLVGAVHWGDGQGRARLYNGWGDHDGDGAHVGGSADAAQDCDDENPHLGLPQTWYIDADGDGLGAPDTGLAACARIHGRVAAAGDCDDMDPLIGPASTWYADEDGDGHGDPHESIEACEQPDGHAEYGEDCDDHDPTRWEDCPEVEEVDPPEPDEADEPIDSGTPEGDSPPWDSPARPKTSPSTGCAVLPDPRSVGALLLLLLGMHRRCR